MKHWTDWVVFLVTAWPVISGLFTAIYKPRDPEGWARLTKFMAALVKFVGATGFDVPKALKALKEFKHGHQGDSKIQINHNEVQ